MTNEMTYFLFGELSLSAWKNVAVSSPSQEPVGRSLLQTGSMSQNVCCGHAHHRHDNLGRQFWPLCTRQTRYKFQALVYILPPTTAIFDYAIDPNTKRFKPTLIYFNTDTQYAHFRGNPLYQATKRHLNNNK